MCRLQLCKIDMVTVWSVQGYTRLEPVVEQQGQQGGADRHGLPSGATQLVHGSSLGFTTQGAHVHHGERGTI